MYVASFLASLGLVNQGDANVPGVILLAVALAHVAHDGIMSLLRRLEHLGKLTGHFWE